MTYLPTPEPGAPGANVDPLGEGLMRLFPDGFAALLAPAAALPASLLMVPFGELPVVLVELPVVFVELPVVVPLVVPLAAEPPAVEPPPTEPPADCASATVLESASAVANPTVASLMVISFFGGHGQTDHTG